jgi:hypothetical protein
MVWPLLAALIGPMPYRLVRPGAMSSTMASNWVGLSFELLPGLAEGECETADLGLADGLLTVSSALSEMMPQDMATDC